MSSGTTGTPVILIGGYYQDVSQASLPSLDPSIIPIPEVTAADVVDRETLKAFVHGVKESFITAMEQIGLEQLIQQRAIFREEGSPWKKGSVYFFVFSTDGYVLFHGVDPSLELNTSDLDKEDVNGVKYLRELIRVAKEGGGFVQYNFDDPAVTGDEDTGSPKVSYAELFNVPRSGVCLWCRVLYWVPLLRRLKNRPGDSSKVTFFRTRIVQNTSFAGGLG